MYNNEHVAIKMVSARTLLFINLLFHYVLAKTERVTFYPLSHFYTIL